MSLINPSDDTTTERPAKKQKQMLGASDRIMLDVGGTKFVAAASTLTSNSAYFASLLSGTWGDSNDGQEVFLDQDPVPFRILLGYMRRGMMKVEDIDTDVLALAEFLGVDRLLLAVKVRWYNNIGKGSVLSGDYETAAAFDQEYGGITAAISADLFQYFNIPGNSNAERDFATVEIVHTREQRSIKIKRDGCENMRIGSRHFSFLRRALSHFFTSTANRIGDAAHSYC